MRIIEAFLRDENFTGDNMSDERHPGRRENESIFYYFLRVNHGIDRQDPVEQLMQLGWSYESAMDAIWGRLLPQSDDWKEYALQCRERRVGKKRLTINHVWSLVNLIWPVSYEQVYELLAPPNRKEKNREKHARYRAKNRKLLSQKQLTRYYRKKSE